MAACCRWFPLILSVGPCSSVGKFFEPVRYDCEICRFCSARYWEIMLRGHCSGDVRIKKPQRLGGFLRTPRPLCGPITHLTPSRICYCPDPKIMMPQDTRCPAAASRQASRGAELMTLWWDSSPEVLFCDTSLCGRSLPLHCSSGTSPLWFHMGLVEMDRGTN